jgi:hypothetical protein
MRQPQLLHDDTKTRVWFEQGHLVRQNYQPSRSAVLDEVKFRRDHPGTVKDVGFGRAVLSIPQHDFQRLIKAYPDLISLDAIEQTKAWHKFMRSSESVPFRNFPKIKSGVGKYG